MNCKLVRSEIALYAGNDLDESVGFELERHLAKCPACRQHCQNMKGSLAVLHRFNDNPDEVTSPSLWPRVATRIARQAVPASLDRFNGWIPAMAIVAACLMIAVFAQNPAPQPSLDTQWINQEFRQANLSENWVPYYPDASWERSDVRRATLPAQQDDRPRLYNVSGGGF